MRLTSESDWRKCCVVTKAIKADEAGMPIHEIDSPQIDAEDRKIERLNKQKKNIQIRKKQFKIRDQQKDLANLKRGKQE